MDEDENRIQNGWSQKFHIIISLTHLFRTLPNLTRRQRNKEMKAYNGNKKATLAPSFNVMHQNIPGKKSKKQVGTYLDNIMKRFRPAILFISEVDPSLV